MTHLPPKLCSFLKFLTRPIVLTITSTVLILFFVLSMFLTFAPIVKIEAIYQYHHILQEYFGVTDLRGLFIPNFHFDILESTHRDFGMSVSSLYLDEPIIMNVDPNDKTQYVAALKKGIAHAAGTQLPGNPGLGYYFAHSSHPDVVEQYNAVFYLLGKLKPDDEVDIWFKEQKYSYVVTQLKETAPNDVSFLQQHYDKETIVLQTCWPPGTTARRLLVFAVRK